MNQTVESKQLEAFEVLIEASLPYQPVGISPFNRNFRFIDLAGIRKARGHGLFRRCLWMEVLYPRPGMFIPVAGAQGSARDNSCTEVSLAIFYPELANPVVCRDLIPADGKQIKGILEDSGRYISGVNSVRLTGTELRTVGGGSIRFGEKRLRIAPNLAMVFSLSIDSSESI